MADACRLRGIPIRIGVNGGSLEKGLLTKEEKRLWLDMAELLELREADPERDRARTEFEQRMRG